MLNRIREKLKNRKVRYVITAAAVVLLAVGVIFLTNALKQRTYSSFRVVLAEERIDSVSRCGYTPDGVVRYSLDGAALINQKLETVWSVTYAMSDPRIDVCGKQVLLYDRMGTAVYLYDSKKQRGAFETPLPILAACVSEKGTAAVILKDGEKTELMYYDKSGSLIAGGESSITSPGYPVALSITDDGCGLAVAYMTVTDGNIGSLVRFYDFHQGKRDGDTLAGEIPFSGVFVPDVRYLNGDECVIFRDDGFTVCRGIANPKETKSVDFDEEIVSVFRDGSHMGFVFRSTEKGHRFLVNMYSTSGNLQSSMYIDHSYDRVHVCGDQIIFSDSANLSIYSTRGVCRYQGKLRDGNIRDVLKIGRNRFFVLTDQAAEVLELVK
ncbi:MAG: hypothetical protein J6E44_08230 [Lachnospiraceae bacterium]|nr:hypothetical protein [Lachnospiraceae bacterium]